MGGSPFKHILNKKNLSHFSIVFFMMRRILFLVVSSFLLGFNTVYAQVAGGDLPFLSSYKEEIRYFQELITGGQYAEPSPLIKGDPYHFSRQFEAGSLRINGITYPQVPLVYDVFRDQLVTFHPVFNQKILIKPEKIDGFTLSNGQRFRYVANNTSYIHHGNGIYEVLAQGKALALAKRYKTSKSIRELSRFDEEYVAKVDYFILSEGVFFPVNSSKQAFAALGLSSKAVKKELKSKGLQFGRSPESFLQFLVTQPRLN